MFRTLYTRLAAVLFLLFCLVAGAYVALMMTMTRMYIDEVNQRLNSGLAATIAREKPVVHNGQIDRRMLNQVFDALMAVNPDIEIYLLDGRGRILAYSAPPGKVKRTEVSLWPIRRFLSGERPPIHGDDPRDLHKKKIFSATRLQPDGYLYVILGGEDYDSVAHRVRGSWILEQSVEIVVAAIVFAFLAGLLLFGLLTRRLRILAGAMERFKRSDFFGEVPLTVPVSGSKDEVGRLARTFEEMAERITMQVKKLKEVDLLRRELVANVSHDLRTPLAALRGYLDTVLLKEGQLAPEEQRRFLEIASKHSERLGCLVDELFELARLDSQVTPIKVEPFSMSELVQDVVQKYELHAQQAGVRLAADFRPDLPMVSGDIALMERVLENLIENAIRHTPAGGSVTVSVVPEDGKLLVRVADTGSGITEESLPYIFDRFYRGEDAARRGAGAGLGLAIAKRILELHGTSLRAQSKVNAGTTFSFAV